MPELPEVETIRRGLLQKLVGQQVDRIDVHWQKSFPADDLKNLIHHEITDIERRGKVLIIRLANDYSLLIHLKMTGQLVFDEKVQETSNKKQTKRRFAGGHPTKSMMADLPDSSTRVIFTFKNRSNLFFNDQRKFGWIKLVPNDEVNKNVLIARLGPEPLSEGFLLTDFRQIIQRRNAPIKAVILDQSTLAGVGNIYVDEALHLAKIHPLRKASSLSKKEIETLYNSIIQILKLGLEHGGTSFTNYVNVDGIQGDYLKYARAFRREGKPCPVCGTIIQKIKVAGRGTHVCPKCQNLKT